SGPAVAVVPVAGRLDLKAMGAVLGGKRAALADAATAERVTGYVIGGISPLGQRRRPPPAVGESALSFETNVLLARPRGLADAATAERVTGYVIGGISPLGQRRRLPTVVDESALSFETIFFSAGRRGLQVEAAPADLIRLTGAVTAPIAKTG